MIPAPPLGLLWKAICSYFEAWLACIFPLASILDANIVCKASAADSVRAISSFVFRVVRLPSHVNLLAQVSALCILQNVPLLKMPEKRSLVSEDHTQISLHTKKESAESEALYFEINDNLPSRLCSLHHLGGSPSTLKLAKL